MNEWGAFLKAFYGQTRPAYTGSGLIVLTTLWQFLANPRQLPLVVGCTVAALAFLLALKGVWHDQRQELENEKRALLRAVETHKKEIELIKNEVEHLRARIDAKPLSPYVIKDALLKYAKDGETLRNDVLRTPKRDGLQNDIAKWKTSLAAYCTAHLKVSGYDAVINCQQTNVTYMQIKEFFPPDVFATELANLVIEISRIVHGATVVANCIDDFHK